jgi:hypothetical protein
MVVIGEKLGAYKAADRSGDSECRQEFATVQFYDAGVYGSSSGSGSFGVLGEGFIGVSGISSDNSGVYAQFRHRRLGRGCRCVDVPLCPYFGCDLRKLSNSLRFWS